MTLVDKESGEQHPYYRTAKKIVDYCIKLKDTTGFEFPILGVCQGFELLGIVAAGNSKSLLKNNPIYNQRLQVGWSFPND